MKLKDKVAFVTGGSSGIGRGICHAFAKEGASIVFIGLNEEKGKRTEKELVDLGSEALYIQADLSDTKGLPHLIDRTVEKFGRLDVLVNNAHSSKMATIEETTEEMMNVSLNTGLWATFTLMQSALPYLKETKGKVKLGELADYLKKEVPIQSLKINSKKQTPTVAVSPGIEDTWRKLKIVGED